MSWRERLAQNPSTMELLLAERLQKENLRYRTQEPIWVSNADFYFDTGTRPLVVFVDGPPHFEINQAKKDEIFRTAIRMSGYRVLELPYKQPSDRLVETFLEQIKTELAKLG